MRAARERLSGTGLPAARAASSRRASRRRPGCIATSSRPPMRVPSAAPERPSASATTSDKQLGLLVQLGVGRGDVALELGPDLGEHREDLGADPVAGVSR